MLLVLLRDYYNLLNLYNVAELSSNRTDGNGIQVESENEKCIIMCSRSPQNLEFGNFTLLFGRDYGEEMYQDIVQGVCFSH